jgi:predicted ATP-dependent endonuclease of OLD family
MFENLHLEKVGTFDGCDLLGLQKVNVICGKNNSGKSTLLNALNDPQNRRLGISPTQDRLNEIINASINAVNTHSGIKSSSGFRGIEVEFRAMMEAVYQTNTIWWPEDQTAFQGRWNVQHKLHQNLRRAHNLRDDRAVSASYSRLFRNLRTVLIPPGRVIRYDPEIHTDSIVSPSGDGLMNRLFHLKSQVIESPARVFFDKLSVTFEEISGGSKFNIVTGTNNTCRLLFKNQSEWVDAPACGLGLQHLLLLLYFSLNDDYPVVLIEEPESHIHPEMQRRLLRFLTVETNKQYFVTTHSNVFLDSTFVGRVFYTRFDDGIKVDDETPRAALLSNLGYEVADNLAADVIILVEGPTDVPVLEQFLLKLGVYGKYDIKIWPMGGDIMDQLDLSVFLHGPKVVALIDQDPKSRKVRTRFKKTCDKFNIPVTRLVRYAIENYFPISALRQVFKGQISSAFNYVEPGVKLEDQIGINVKNNNHKLAKATDIADLDGTDLLNFLRGVVRLCTQR